MSDIFYNIVCALGSHAFWVNSSPRVLNAHRTAMKGAYVLASTHSSPFDVPLLIRHAKRKLDFVSIVEVFAKPLVGWFYGHMNAFPLDRSRNDSKTVRIIRDRLRRGRVIAMFPEGNIRTPDSSVLNGGSLKAGVARLAMMVKVPIIPVVILDSGKYGNWKSWLPLRRTKYSINFGEPIIANDSNDPKEEARNIEIELKAAFLKLYQELIDDKNGLRLNAKEPVP